MKDTEAQHPHSDTGTFFKKFKLYGSIKCHGNIQFYCSFKLIRDFKLYSIVSLFYIKFRTCIELYICYQLLRHSQYYRDCTGLRQVSSYCVREPV
ncbi:hypothetical protein UCRPA7_8659 [Phaeoacremonium minimum UCRPA7]|uniref:Uncharacterized protein n=1 Tax=Phaeoacremonium minimum (strain UCR-PA7) TaxID=1286976 RepID=R8B9A1_PHAM7|nr:hypothetical protein UCRPA7_8659 [Phaeoacremonium minimum UCRPA7]EON95866.1 hypothetical protein UCRPA7_8659 [Phaeoacremonium minimum UCRPA7]